MRNYLELSGGEGSLFVAANHPALDNFSFQVGFYLINTDKQLENSPRNGFNKFVEVGDKITITPYNVETNHGRSEIQETELDHQEIKDCDICQKNRDSEEK